MEFFNSAVDVLKTLVVALGAGLGVWGAVNLVRPMGRLARTIAPSTGWSTTPFTTLS